MTFLCYFAQRTFTDDDVHYSAILAEYMKQSVSSEWLLQSLKEWHPRLVLGPQEHSYSKLRGGSSKVYRAAVSTAGVERHQRIVLCVLWSRRGQLGEAKAERKVTVEDNDGLKARATDAKRGQVDYFIAAATGNAVQEADRE